MNPIIFASEAFFSFTWIAPMEPESGVEWNWASGELRYSEKERERRDREWTEVEIGLYLQPFPQIWLLRSQSLSYKQMKKWIWEIVKRKTPTRVLNEMTQFTENERCFLISCPFIVPVFFSFPPAGNIFWVASGAWIVYKPNDTPGEILSG